MKTGRELDALIAEKVMGLDLSQECSNRELHEYYDGWACIACSLKGSWGEQDEKYFDHTIEPPHYSTQIADAWLVVKKFPNVAIFGPNDSWLVRFSDESGSLYTHPVDEPARADTAPLAICLAALKAVDE